VSPENKNGDSRAWAGALRDMAPYLGIGATLAVTVLLGVGVGYWLDGRLKTSPAFLLAGAVIGILSAGYHFYRLVKVKR
jgi:F0F1-type ATP synthase assembly protein I